MGEIFSQVFKNMGKLRYKMVVISKISHVILQRCFPCDGSQNMMNHFYQKIGE